MSETDGEIKIKQESRCKCCLDNMGSLYMWEEYYNNDEREVYGEMLMECFALTWYTQEGEMICESCIYRLRDALKLKIEFLAVQELIYESVMLEGQMGSINKSEGEALNENALEETMHEEHLQSEYIEEEDENIEEEMEIENLELSDYEPEEPAVSDEEPKRKYPKKKKPNERKMYKMYGREDMRNALEAVREHGMKIVDAANMYGIPRKTLTAKLASGADDRDEVKDATEAKQLKLFQEIKTILQYTNALPFKSKTTKYYCAYCSTDGPFFEDPDELRVHTRNEHSEEMISQVELIMRPSWLNEILKMDITGLQCSDCDIMIKDWNSMFVHFAEVHDLEFDEAYTRVIPYSLTADLHCVLCLENFLNFGQLDAHMNAHYSNYICYECGDTFLASSRLEKHLKVHKVGKFPCDKCDKVFTLELYRSRHVNLVHKQVCNIKCLYCSEKFSAPLIRHQHVLEKHPSKVKVLTCELCGKTYTWKPYFIAHKRKAHFKETKQKSYSCTECDKSYSMHFELRNHMMRHKAKKKLICVMCGIAFKKIIDLKTHWKVHEKK